MCVLSEGVRCAPGWMTAGHTRWNACSAKREPCDAYHSLHVMERPATLATCHGTPSDSRYMSWNAQRLSLHVMRTAFIATCIVHSHMECPTTIATSHAHSIHRHMQRPLHAMEQVMRTAFIATCSARYMPWNAQRLSLHVMRTAFIATWSAQRLSLHVNSFLKSFLKSSTGVSTVFSKFYQTVNWCLKSFPKCFSKVQQVSQKFTQKCSQNVLIFWF